MPNKDVKRERFLRIAPKRTNLVLSNLKSLSKCSNRNNYDFKEEEVNKMLKAIKDELRTLETLFKKNLEKDNDTFNF